MNLFTSVFLLFSEKIIIIYIKKNDLATPGTVERQAAHFYRITVTEADLKSGVIISCRHTQYICKSAKYLRI